MFRRAKIFTVQVVGGTDFGILYLILLSYLITFIRAESFFNYWCLGEAIAIPV
ncbi:hypothetical protein [Pseudanabaena sp. BC1403]|uniref:hypothetical protein n=1 Tax=Pseudanabaena sp. BC1403 TaxID=2043171 RepID=UPI0015E18D13|nr:hypothetical protein [Pseudanabaena sp. BC1403]